MAEAATTEPTPGRLESTNGARVFYRAWERPGSRGLILCVHGLGEHSGRYGRLAEAVREVDLDLYALDLRGHGRTTGRRGHVADFADLLRDLDRLWDRACDEVPGRATFVLGHSLGGLVAGRWIETFAPDGLLGAVFVAPFVDVAVQVPGWKRSLGAAADRLVPALSLDNGLALEDLFRRAEDRRAYDDDPLVHRRISARMWGEMGRAAGSLVRDADQLAVPALFQLAGEDRIVCNAAARRLAASLTPPTEVMEYEGAHHALYHDPASGTALADLRAWLGARIDGDAAMRETTAAIKGRTT
jgi:alpha-beta hydrolase superfamily lysophospholipase